MKRTPLPARRAIARWLCLCACLASGACSWIEAEFSTLDRLPPSCRENVDNAPSALVEKP